VPAAVTIVRGNLFTFTATASDPDILNGVGNALTFSLVGAPAGASINPDTGVFTWTPGESVVPDIYSFSVRVADDGVPSKSDTKPIAITVSPAFIVNNNLVIGGTAANDRIAVNPSKDLSQLVVVMNGVTLGTFPAASVTGKIVARGLGGNDKITISPKVTKPTELWGGLGNDSLTGGAGSNVLIGGEGKDLLTGGIGRDVLLGGAGADRLIGGTGEDLLLGGVTDFETDLTGLALIVAEWNSGSLYADRVAHLTGTAGGLNGTAFLSASTVHNDGVKDVLTGGKDSDWFVVSALDTLDLKLPELKLVIL
jgi:Ca2+-binding RTX toxin-like protein